MNSKTVFKFTKHIINESKILKELNINKFSSLKIDYHWRVIALAIWESEFNILGLND